MRRNVQQPLVEAAQLGARLEVLNRREGLDRDAVLPYDAVRGVPAMIVPSE
jgi:hypothetical protein